VTYRGPALDQRLIDAGAGFATWGRRADRRRLGQRSGRSNATGRQRSPVPGCPPEDGWSIVNSESEAPRRALPCSGLGVH
jgi:hypothetical protein